MRSRLLLACSLFPSIFLCLAFLNESGGRVLTLPSISATEPLSSSANSTPANSILNLFRRRRPTWQGTRRARVSCLIAPGNMGNTLAVWSDRPLFIWQGQANDIILRSQNSNSSDPPLWQSSLDPATRYIQYNAVNPLQPGQIYQWQLIYPDTHPEAKPGTEERTNWSLFQVLPPEEREPITAELNRIAQSGQSEEAIALQQALYLAEKDFWSDALQVLYSVQGSSLQVRQLIQEIETDFCRPSPSSEGETVNSGN